MVIPSRYPPMAFGALAASSAAAGSSAVSRPRYSEYFVGGLPMAESAAGYQISVWRPRRPSRSPPSIWTVVTPTGCGPGGSPVRARAFSEGVISATTLTPATLLLISRRVVDSPTPRGMLPTERTSKRRCSCCGCCGCCCRGLETDRNPKTQQPLPPSSDEEAARRARINDILFMQIAAAVVAAAAAADVLAGIRVSLQAAAQVS
mmetsp:Transcript_20881/g.49466  ORF Transcript_20881/g.49466 Transcript_20881/m.49466 type:complete len:205 (-) Transcript_20881:447-1061(-)